MPLSALFAGLTLGMQHQPGSSPPSFIYRMPQTHPHRPNIHGPFYWGAALMALDTTTLKLIMKSGNDKEKRQASKIYPLRKRGNLLLCTLVLGNVLVNNTLTIVLDTLTGSMPCSCVSPECAGTARLPCPCVVSHATLLLPCLHSQAQASLECYGLAGCA
jgi:hypothetical protein